MTFLTLSYLWGLLALAIPISIHLWSRKKVRTIKVGSTKFIAETKSKQSNSIRLNELVLLGLRCLIIAALVAILAQPQWTRTIQNQDVAYIFEPSLLLTEEGRTKFNSIPEEGRLLLQDGFPEWEPDAVMTSEAVPNYWQLAQQFDQIPADSLVVFTHAFAKGIKGKRPTISATVNWISVDPTVSVSETVLAIEKGDSLELIQGTTTNNSYALSTPLETGFAKAYISKNKGVFNPSKDSVQIGTGEGSQWIPFYKKEAVEVVITYNKANETQRVYLEAALKAIAAYTERDINIKAIASDEQVEAVTDYQIILDNRAVTETEIPTLLYQPDALAKKLIAPSDAKLKYVLTQELTPAVVLEEGLVTQLLEWLDLDPEMEKKLDTFDKRTVASDQLATNQIEETETEIKETTATMEEPLWIILLVLLAGERIVAYFRKQ